jgi:type I restriction enzyme R subunit
VEVWFYTFDYTGFFGKSDTERLKTIANGVNFALGVEEDEAKEFVKEATALSQAETLCRSLIYEKLKKK